ncbi:hypothetical protein [Pseudomonas sp.]|uniref:hypothetical protein n=1 Tax=Pseudomonas sp. TaxID=306 RepID=UPI00273277C5|nr:hypothetical protein [Pseudomonas sp.]MDP3813719.1 hypothetical protein [Pseudomonas sp.]
MLRLFALLWLLGLCAPLQAEILTYAPPEVADDPRNRYPLLLLQLALDQAGGDYQLQPSATPMQQGRVFMELAHGRNVRVAWSMTSLEREAQLLPIRIPLYKGLIGWRLALVKAERRELLHKVRNLEELGRFSAGQGHDWPDTEILRANGLPVVGVPNYQSLFSMLTLGRFDYFPRSLAEVWAEAEQQRAGGLVVDDSLVLHYPSAVYFFVNPKDVALAAHIERGLELAIADGSFERLFQVHYGEYIERAQLGKRRILHLNNPLLPPQTPLQRKELWFQPQ